MKKKQLSKSDIKKINQEIEKYKLSINKKDKVELIQDEYDLLSVNDEVQFFKVDGVLIPTLKLISKDITLKTIIVDMGAVRFVVNGADIMRPGITKLDDGIEKDEMVVILDENNHKPLSICKTIFSGEEIQNKDSGKVLQNIHYVGDKIWQSY